MSYHSYIWPWANYLVFWSLWKGITIANPTGLSFREKNVYKVLEHGRCSANDRDCYFPCRLANSTIYLLNLQALGCSDFSRNINSGAFPHRFRQRGYASNPICLFHIRDMDVILSWKFGLQVPRGEESVCVSAQNSLVESSIKSHLDNAPVTKKQTNPKHPKTSCFDSSWDCPKHTGDLWIHGRVAPAETLSVSLSCKLPCFSQTVLTSNSTEVGGCSLKHFTSIQRKRKSTWKIIYEQPFLVFENMPAHLAAATQVFMDFLLLLFVILVR